jgi:hypothetical protein
LSLLLTRKGSRLILLTTCLSRGLELRCSWNQTGHRIRGQSPSSLFRQTRRQTLERSHTPDFIPLQFLVYPPQPVSREATESPQVLLQRAVGRRTGTVNLWDTPHLFRVPGVMGITTFCHRGRLHLSGGVHGTRDWDETGPLGTTPSEGYSETGVHRTLALQQPGSGTSKY